MKINEMVIISKVDGVDGGILFINGSGEYYRVNELALFIIEMIKEGSTIADITKSIVDAYDVSFDSCINDVNRVIDNLIEARIVVR